MSVRKDVVETYFDGFRRSDHELILACLTDDVVWDIVGFIRVVGKEAFDAEIEHEDAAGSPTLIVERVVEEADTVVAIGKGEGEVKSGERHRFAYCTVFTFSDTKISRVDSYVVALT